jgi:murein L,D-transpeptidase YcbB/YkuD
VPKKLARLDLLPKQQQDPNYFIDHDIKVFSINNGQRTELNPNTIDWHSYSSRTTLPYTLRQEPGHHNALGQIKFLFQNPWSIYLHDTPHKSLFNEENRAISSGCIRVEDPIGLANFTLNEPAIQHIIMKNINSEQNIGFKLPQPVRIFAAYFTVSTDNDQLIFLQDTYQRDKRMIKLLY